MDSIQAQVDAQLLGELQDAAGKANGDPTSTPNSIHSGPASPNYQEAASIQHRSRQAGNKIQTKKPSTVDPTSTAHPSDHTKAPNFSQDKDNTTTDAVTNARISALFNQEGKEQLRHTLDTTSAVPFADRTVNIDALKKGLGHLDKFVEFRKATGQPYSRELYAEWSETLPKEDRIQQVVMEQFLVGIVNEWERRGMGEGDEQEWEDVDEDEGDSKEEENEDEDIEEGDSEESTEDEDQQEVGR